MGGNTMRRCDRVFPFLLLAVLATGSALAFSDDFQDPGFTAANWWHLTAGVSRVDDLGNGMLFVKGADDTQGSNSESASTADLGRPYLTDGLTISADVKLDSRSNGYCGFFWGVNGVRDGSFHAYYLALSATYDMLWLTHEDGGEVMLPADLDGDTWYHVEVRSTADTFEIWLGAQGVPPDKLGEVPHAYLLPTHTETESGAVGVFCDNNPYGWAYFDNVSVTGTLDPTPRMGPSLVRALREQPVRVPICITECAGVAGFQLDLLYDTSVLTGPITARIAKGGLTAADPNWFLLYSQPAPGCLRLIGYNGAALALPPGGGELAEVWFSVNPAAASRAVGVLDVLAPTLSDSAGNPIHCMDWDSVARVAPAASHLFIANIADQQAGVPFAISMWAENEFFEPATAYHGTVNVTDLTGSISPATAAFTNGAFSGLFTIELGSPSDQVSIYDPQETALTAGSNYFAVSATGDPPAAATNLQANAVSGTQVDLTWVDNSDNELGFRVWRDDACIATLGPNTTSYSDTTTTPSTTYQYSVAAYNAAGMAFSNPVEITTPGPPPEAPSSLTATTVSASQINLHWQDNSASEIGFIVERHAPAGLFAQIARVGANVTSYQDTAVVRATTYTYRVRAWNANGQSEGSNEALASTPRFNDVLPSSGFFRYIEAIVREGISSGCSTNPPLFCPNSPVTRGQMAVFLCRAAGWDPLYRDVPTFTDVPKSNPQYGYIERLFQQGVTGGCSVMGPQYCPNAPVTRGQMAVFLCRAKGLGPYYKEVPTFTDVPKTSPQYGYVEQLVALGVTGGCSTSPPAYCPTSAVTRGQMAVFLCRTFGIAVE